MEGYGGLLVKAIFGKIKPSGMAANDLLRKFTDIFAPRKPSLTF